MRIGILTGGGDVPGLNACIKAVVERVINDGHEVIGIRRGWAGLLDLELNGEANVDNCVQELDLGMVRTVDRDGGTFLHTSRTNPERIRTSEIPRHLSAAPGASGPHDFTDHVIRVIDHLELDALIPIGGDDTLSYALRLHERDVPVVAIPKTMDNDVHGTDYCIGFSTAVTRSVEFIHQLRTSTGSHERLAVVELFGRQSGETSLVSAYLASIDRAVISEVPFDPDRLAALLMEDKRRNPSSYAMCTISEGARTVEGSMHQAGQNAGNGHRTLGEIGQDTARILRELTGQEVVSQALGYLMRSGRPDALDLMVATNFAVMAADLTVAGERGRMVALRSGTYTNVPIDTVGEGVRRVDVDALYDRESYRPKVREVAGKPMFLY
ncbi:MAG: ATP-dependent 6-phosphofructokinase [Nitriliruptoraceae bacterium]